MKPIVIYVDDEPRNLTVFEAALPEDWEVLTFDSAVNALQTMKKIKPWVIVSDQRMPMMTGLEFLEVASQLVPDAQRIVVTGQTEEATIVELVRRAKIYDYITKPWDADDLETRLAKAIELFQAIQERKRAFEELKHKNVELEQRAEELAAVNKKLSDAKRSEIELRKEVEAWAPAPIVWAVREGNLQFPMKRDIVGLVFDIVQSSRLHNQLIHDCPVRYHVLKFFTEVLIKHGGLRESHSGDSAYGHFGAFQQLDNPFEAAMSVAKEFRLAVENFSRVHNMDVNAGVALHYVPEALIQVHEFRADTQEGPVIQKSFDSTSSHIDLLHRMEKLTHSLPGSNIIVSRDFLDRIEGSSTSEVFHLGKKQMKGQADEIDLYLIPSDHVDQHQLDAFKAEEFASIPTLDLDDDFSMAS